MIFLHGTQVINLTTPDHLDGRIILAAVVSIFYPLGLLSPNIIPHMIFLQTLWLEKLEYGELIPP